MKHLGLFEGIGGFSLAAKWMGWQTVAWCEIDLFCQKILKYYFPNSQGYGDIKQTDFSRYANQIDILTGGFPCQPYSLAGKRLGAEDDRHLWPEMLRVVREVRPRYVVGENVFGIVNWNGGVVFNQVQVDLENEGYEVWPFILPACAVDAPHRRDRVWFVAKNANGDGRKGDERQEESYKRQQRHIGPGNNERVSSNVEEISDAANANGIRQPREEYRDEGTKFYCKNSKINSWHNFPTQSPVCSGNDGIPSRLDGITFPKWRNESIKAYGNAIVPQVALQIFKAIQKIDQL